MSVGRHRDRVTVDRFVKRRGVRAGRGDHAASASRTVFKGIALNGVLAAASMLTSR